MKNLLLILFVGLFLASCAWIPYEQDWRCEKPYHIYDSTVNACVPDMEGTSQPERSAPADVDSSENQCES
jgi:hypothetical protein